MAAHEIGDRDHYVGASAATFDVRDNAISQPNMTATGSMPNGAEMMTPIEHAYGGKRVLILGAAGFIARQTPGLLT